MRFATACVLLVLSVAACAFEIPHFDLPEVALPNQHSLRVASHSCPTYSYTCVAQGGNCSYSLSTPNQVPICFDGMCGDDGLCPVIPKLGQACTTICTTGLECSLVSKTCVPLSTIGQPGASCDSNAQCTLTNSTGTYSVCQNGFCIGVPLGEACTLDGECRGLAFCKKGVCAPLVSAKGYCSAAVPCAPMTTCNRNKCVPVGSVKKNKLCTANEACADGLTCNDKTKKCTPKTYSGACNSNADCKISNLCSCDNIRSFSTCSAESVNPTGTAKVMAAFGACATKNQCASVNCFEQKCPAAYCAYRNLLLNEYFPSDSNCLYSYSRQIFGQYVIPGDSCSS